MTDPVVEVEARVESIIKEHAALWGCDDPACAVRSSNYVAPVESARPWWKKIIRGRR